MDRVCAKTVQCLVALSCITYGTDVFRSNLIKATALSFCFLSLSTSVVQARELTPKEIPVCESLRACIDIVRRHDASEFDYAVLETQFRRFGSAGKAALFGLLESDAGQADIARMISAIGPLTVQDRQRVQTKWTQENARSYLPLLLDGHPMSRDLLLKSLGHPEADVREQVRMALIRLPETVKRAPLPKGLQGPLLSALLKDPIEEVVPYLARVDAAGYEEQLSALLRSGEGDVVTVAYSALYRNNPAQAFNALLAEMERLDTPAQVRAIGQMLATRHKTRSDGFYLKFSRDMSGDAKLSIPARASGLHSLLTVADGLVPDMTPARAEAFSFLLKGQPFTAQDHYIPYLKAAGADEAMTYVWEVAQGERWINRDRIADFYIDHSSYDEIIGNLIQSDDVRSFSAGVALSKPIHARYIRAQIDHPVKEVSKAARQKLGLPEGQNQNRKCPIRAFDLEDMRAQMPFFESGWMIANNKARVAVSRSHLTTAHPSSSGWLAGYDLSKPGSRSIHDGGGVLHYDNKSGAFEVIGEFAGPIAILPGQPLKLGQTTERFWIVDLWGGDASDVSAYTLDISSTTPRITHIDALPTTAQDFAVAPNGDLVILFEDAGQMPIRLSKTGQMSLVCPTPQHSNAPRAPH